MATAKGKKGRKGTKRSRKNRGPRAMLVSEITPGTGEDIVLIAFDTREKQIQDQYDREILGIRQAREAYKGQVGVGGSSMVGVIPKTIPLTSKGTPDMRSKAGQEYAKAHPEAMRAD